MSETVQTTNQVELPFPDVTDSPGIETRDTMAEAGRKVLRHHFARMLNHEEGTRLGEDIEELHDMRVATRRMRAAFDVFGDAFQRKVVKRHLKGLRTTGRALGRVRDLDVFMEKAQRYLDTLLDSEQQGLNPLLNSWQQERELARERMLAYLDSNKYQKFNRRFNIFLSTPGIGVRQSTFNELIPFLVQNIAPKLIFNCIADVYKFEKDLEGPTIEQLHALRIKFKKLRYTVEFFREVLGEHATSIIKDVKKMQDHLGDLNDTDVACQILGEFINSWDDHYKDYNPLPVMAYLDTKKTERQHLINTFPEAWFFFNRTEFHKRLELALSVL